MCVYVRELLGETISCRVNYCCSRGSLRFVRWKRWFSVFEKKKSASYNAQGKFIEVKVTIIPSIYQCVFYVVYNSLQRFQLHYQILLSAAAQRDVRPLVRGRACIYTTLRRQIVNIVSSSVYGNRNFKIQTTRKQSDPKSRHIFTANTASRASREFVYISQTTKHISVCIGKLHIPYIIYTSGCCN